MSATPSAYAREILNAGPEADLGALISDMREAYARLTGDAEEAQYVLGTDPQPPRPGDRRSW